MNVLRDLGWSPSTILDVGAFHGTWTRAIKTQFPAARVTLVEANAHPRLYEGSLGRIVQAVVSDRVGTAPWYSVGETGDSLFQEQTAHYVAVPPVLRETTTLDTLFPGETFDFIKLDCQGAELAILRGGPRVLEGTEVLLLECPFAGVYNANAPTFAETIRDLDALGFAPLEIPELHRANGVLCQIDILFLRKSSPLWSRIQATLAA